MLAWLSANGGTIIAALVLALIVAAIVVRMAKNHRAGKSSCGCGCGGCPNAGFCHPDREKTKSNKS